MRKVLSALALASVLFLADCAAALPAMAQAVKVLNTNGHLTTFQQTVTASAAALPSWVLTNGLTCTAKAGNTATVEFGGSAAVTAASTGSGSGAIVSAGQTVGPMLVSNSNQVWIIGTAGDVVSCWGN